MVDSMIPWISPSEGIIISMCFCISLFEEWKPCLIGISIMREIEGSRSSLIHRLMPLLQIFLCAMVGNNGIISDCFGADIFIVLNLQIEMVIYDGEYPIRVTAEDKTINTW